MLRATKLLFILILMGIPFGIALADTPPSIEVTDTHSVENKGKINLYRVQVQGLEFGRGKEEVDAEVLVTLDTQPGFVYTLRLHPDSPPINRVIADTLRDAYLNQTPVTLYHQIAPGGKRHLKIHMIQMNSK